MHSDLQHTSSQALAHDLEPTATQIQGLIGAIGMKALTSPEAAKEISSFADELHGRLARAELRIRCDLEEAWTPRGAELLDSIREQIVWASTIQRDGHVGTAAAAGLRSGSRKLRWFLEDAGLPGQTLEGPEHAFAGGHRHE